jgi:hypothetical protein
MTEAEIKRRIVKNMQANGGYGRRLEDQYTVGTYDMILIPLGLPVFMAEVKMLKDNVFGPTARQLIELNRIADVSANIGHVIPVMIGWKDGVFYFHKPQSRINCKECFSLGSTVEFYNQLVQYYYSIRG